jgi:hypothetical protein
MSDKMLEIGCRLEVILTLLFMLRSELNTAYAR